MTNYIFINPQLIAKIEEKVNRLMIDWEINPNERHMVYQMTAAIESGVDTKVFYHNDGIVCDGWNGYRHYQGSEMNGEREWRNELNMIRSGRVVWQADRLIPEIKNYPEFERL
jgi:hypothetical protein